MHLTERTLMDHQLRALDYLAEHPHGNALLMEMRLGKTLVCIRAAKALWPARHRILVVAPRTVLLSWREELKEEGELYHLLAGSPLSRKADLDRIDDEFAGRRIWVLVSYGVVRSDPSISQRCWDWAILDESTAIKNPKARITRIVNATGRSSRSLGFNHSTPRTILTGSISPENLLEVYEQLRFAFGEFLNVSSYWDFRSRYFKRTWNGYDWVPKPGMEHRIREAVKHQCFMLTRKQAHIGPKKVHSVRYVDLSPKLMKQYRETEDTFEFEGLSTKWVPVLQTWLGRLAGGTDPSGRWISDHKFAELRYLLETELRNEKVVIWFHFNAELVHVADSLQKLGYRVGRILGETPLDSRRTTIRDFRTSRLQVLCMQMAVGSHGLDLSVADTAIYYSTSYSAEKRMQSEDRIVHPSKSSPVLFIDLITTNTVDADCLKALREKRMRGKLFSSSLREAFHARRTRS